MSKFSLFFLILVFSNSLLFGQVNLQGEVKHANSGLDGVTIQVFEKAALVRTLRSNKRGKFEMELPFEKEYLLVFRAPYMIPVRMKVNTHTATLLDSRDLTINVPLQMETFHRYKGMNISAYDEPIGEVKNLGTGENSFEFVPNLTVISKVKSVNAESIKREQNGEQPIDSDQPSLPSESQPELTSKMSSVKETSSIEFEEDEINSSSSEKVNQLRTDRNISNYDRVEDAENSKIVREQELYKSQISRALMHDEDKESYIATSKISKSQNAQIAMLETEHLTDVKVHRQSSIDSHLAEAASLKRVVGYPSKNTVTMPVKKSMEKGMFYTETRLSVIEANKSQLYRKVTYDYWFFDIEYYYKNDQEISGKLYDEVELLFN